MIYQLFLLFYYEVMMLLNAVVLLKYTRLFPEKDVDWMGAYCFLKPVFTFQH